MQSYSLESWLQTLANQTIERPPGQALKDLKLVAERLDLLDFKIPIISVSGTNGKGSAVACLTDLYTKAGFSTGTFTSPHLFKFNERIQLAGQMVSDAAILDAFEQIEPASKRIPLAYFQYAFLAALLIFKASDLDLLILEVGIGGRYDAINILDADLTIITNVALDHCALLGSTREAIAKDKSGLFRQNRLTVFGEKDVPLAIQKRALDLNLLLYSLGQGYQIEEREKTWRYFFNEKQLEFKKGSLMPVNIAAALTAIFLLQDRLPVSLNIMQSVENLSLVGRAELIKRPEAQFLFDVAHNPAAVQHLRDLIVERQKRGGRVFAIAGFMRSKDVKGMISLLSNTIDHWCFTETDDLRMLDTEDFKLILKDFDHLKADFHRRPKNAYLSVLKVVRSQDLVVVFGSFVIVSEILKEVSGG